MKIVHRKNIRKFHSTIKIMNKEVHYSEIHSQRISSKVDTAIPHNDVAVGMYNAVGKRDMTFSGRRYHICIHRCRLEVISANFHRSVFLDELFAIFQLHRDRKLV